MLTTTLSNNGIQMKNPQKILLLRVLQICKKYQAVEELNSSPLKSNKLSISRTKIVAIVSLHFMPSKAEQPYCYDCAWLSLTALSTVTRNLWL
jgi:hypothetical protein